MKKQKLYDKIRNNPRNVRFSDFITVIGYFGFVLRRIEGSHQIYRNPNVPTKLVAQPENGKAKEYQVLQFLQLVDKHNLKMEEGD